MPYFKNNYNTKKANEEKYEETKVKTIEYIKKAAQVFEEISFSKITTKSHTFRYRNFRCFSTSRITSNGTIGNGKIRCKENILLDVPWQNSNDARDGLFRSNIDKSRIF